MDTKKVADDLYNKFYDLLFTSDFREVESKKAAILCVSEKRETLCMYANSTTGQGEKFRQHFDELMEVKEHLNNM